MEDKKLLLPCPYCGNETIDFWEEKDGDCFFYCEPCGVCGPRGRQRGEAIGKWNAMPRENTVTIQEHGTLTLEEAFKALHKVEEILVNKVKGVALC